MSLLSSASPWTNDEDASRKRIPTIRKAMKKPATSPENVSSQAQVQPQAQAPVQNIAVSSYSAVDDQDNDTNVNMQTLLSEQDARTSRVNQLLNQMSAYNTDNAGQALANFQPLSHPAVQKRTDMETGVMGREGDPVLGALPNPLQIPPPSPIHSHGSANFSAHGQDLGNVSHYTMAYAPPAPIHTLAASSSSPLDAKLLEKINYMIYLLEQQHNEKTSNITEEFILYTFLGVFIIFIVDSFARAGKYIR